VVTYAVSTFIFEWIWGVLSDRFDRRAFIALGLVSGSVFVWLYTFENMIPLFYVLQFLRGGLFIMVGPAVKALVSDLSSSRRLGLSMGLYSATRTLGGVAGPFLGSSVAQFWSYEHALYAYSVISVVGVLMTLTIVKTGNRSSSTGDSSSGLSQDWRQLFAKDKIAVLFVFPVIVFMGNTAINSYLPLYASETVGMSTLEIGTLFSIASVSGFLATPLFGWVSDRVGRRPVVLSGFLLSATMLCSLFFAGTPLYLTLALIGLKTCFLPMTPLLLAMLSEVAPPRLLGASMGIYSTFENLGTVVAPPIYSALWTTYAPGTIFLFSALTQTLVIPLLLPTKKNRTTSTNNSQN